jgi:predicted metal-dependent hydrolase
MSNKSPRIAAMVEQFAGRELDKHYLGFFELFNKQLFYEAHDVLEELWLPNRKGPNDLFYKGLIQLAGAFVHLQKKRLGPALALFKLSKRNLEIYSSPHERLDMTAVLLAINQWSGYLLQNPEKNPLEATAPFKLELILQPEAEKTAL